MATVYERPVSVTIPTNPPQQHRLSIVPVGLPNPIPDYNPNRQIIDVDELDDDEIEIMPREVITIVDSDDEGVDVGVGVAPNRPRLRSLPPPHRHPSIPPPVPALPPLQAQAQAQTQTRPNLHRRSVFPGIPTHATPPVIRAIERPLEINAPRPSSRPAPPPAAGPAHALPHPNRHRRNPHPNPNPYAPQAGAEPQPRHVPALGLGGAIVTMNHPRPRARAGPQGNNPQRAGDRRRNEGQWQGAVRRLYTATVARFGRGFWDEEVAEDGNGDGVGEDEDEDVFGDPQLPLYPQPQQEWEWGDFGRFGYGFRTNAHAHENRYGYGFGVLGDVVRGGVFDGNTWGQPEQDYREEYTHPGKPEPNFVFSFAQGGDGGEGGDGPGIGAGLASRENPIIIDLDTDEGPIAGPSTIKHPVPVPVPEPVPEPPQTVLVCARCKDPLVLSAGLVGEDARSRRIWALRCGHMVDGKCLDVVGRPFRPEHEEQGEGEGKWDGKGKGKGKARMVDIDEGVGVDEHGHMDMDVDVDRDMTTTDPNPNTVRSRLRSHAHRRVPPPPMPTTMNMGPGPSSSFTSISSTTASTSPSLGKRKRGITHSKRAHPHRVEETFEWPCPIDQCKRIHVSVRVDGVWGPEPDPNAISGAGPGAGAGRGRGRRGILKRPLGALGAGMRGEGRGAILVFV